MCAEKRLKRSVITRPRHSRLHYRSVCLFFSLILSFFLALFTCVTLAWFAEQDGGPRTAHRGGPRDNHSPQSAESGRS